MDDTKSMLTGLLIKVLKPIARMMLSKNMSFGEFSELAREIFVGVVIDNFMINGQKISNDRIAVITGIHRKDVRRIRKTTESGTKVSINKHNRVERVIHGWVNDPAFRDRSLSCETDSEFYELVKKYGGDVLANSILEEMLRLGNVEVKDNVVTLVKSTYIPSDDENELLRRYGVSVTDFMDTMAYNVQHSADNKGRLEMQVAYDNLPLETLTAFIKYTNKKANKFLDDTNDWLAKRDRDSNPEVDGEGRHRAGIGVYYFEHVYNDTNETQEQQAKKLPTWNIYNT